MRVHIESIYSSYIGDKEITFKSSQKHYTEVEKVLDEFQTLYVSLSKSCKIIIFQNTYVVTMEQLAIELSLGTC